MSFTENNKFHTEHLYGLRALCALIVALYHYKTISTSTVTDNLFIENGYRFVDVFFSLSGFILYFSYSEINKNIKSIFSFLKRRFLRLYPLHLLLLFLFFLIEIMKLYFEQNYDLYGNTHSFELLNIKSFFLKLLMLEGFWGNVNATLALNPVSWSISVEFVCYILMIFMIVFIKNKFHIFAFILITFSCLLVLIFKKSFFAIGSYMCLVRGFYSFFLPIIIYILFKKINFKNNNFISYIIFFSFLYLITINSIISYVLCPILISFFINCTLKVGKKNHLINLLNLNFFTFLGKISYGVYMFHVLIWWSISQFFRFILKYDTKILPSKDIEIIDLTPLESNIILVLGLLMIISISSLSYNFFEKKFYK